MPRRNAPPSAPPLRTAPLITFPQLALALSVRQEVIRTLCLSAGIRSHRAYPRGQDRLTFEQAERVAELLSESAP